MENPFTHIPDWLKFAIGAAGVYVIKPMWQYLNTWLSIKSEIRKKELETTVQIDANQFEKLKALQTLATEASKNEIDVFEYIKNLFKGELEYVKSELDRVRKSNKQDIEQLRSSNSVLVESNLKLQLEFNSQKIEIDRLTKMVNNYSISHPDSPEPMWLKGLDGIMISLNDAYEQVFLLPQGFTRDNYIGFPDEVIWGANIAAKFAEFDKRARRDETDVIIEEMNNGNTILDNWVFIKMPYWKKGQLIGIAGRAIRKDVYEHYFRHHQNNKKQNKNE